MRHTAVAGHLKPEEIKERMLSSESRQQFQQWQIIYITVTKRLKAEAVSELVGVCTGTVHQWVHQYNHKGPDVFILQGRGGRRRELLSWNEEEELLEVFFQDKARFDRMSNPARCWAPAGFRPIVPVQRVIVMVMDGAPWHKAKDLGLSRIFESSFSPHIALNSILRNICGNIFVKTISKTGIGL